MANDTITFALAGRVELDVFSDAIKRLKDLVHALTREVGDGRDVRWVVSDLQVGSATATLRGESGDMTKIERVVEAYGKVGAALERHEVIDFGVRVIKAAEAVSSLATKRVEYIRFETSSDDFTVHKQDLITVARPIVVSIGGVEGRIQTLSNRGTLRFNLYDTIHDRPVACYLQEGQEELMREAWGRRARVSGRVSRERETGRPVAVRGILDVEILAEVEPASYRVACGAIPWEHGQPMPEQVIRQLRDA